MRREAFVLVAAVSFAIGVVLPLVLSNLIGPSGLITRTVTVPVYVVDRSSGIARYANASLPSAPGLRKFGSYGELVGYVNEAINLNELATRLGATPIAPRPLPMLTEFTPPPTTLPDSKQVYRTNVQVEGIDEPDIVKTNGKLMFVTSGSKVFIISITEKNVVSALAFDERVAGLFLYGNRLVVIAETHLASPVAPETECKCIVVPARTPSTVVYVYDVANASNPTILTRISVTGSMLSSRLSNGYVYLVTDMSVSENTVPLVNGEPVPLDTVSAVDQNPTAYTVVLALDLEKLEYSVYTFLTGGGSWLYMSLENLYVACQLWLNPLDAYSLVLNAVAKYVSPGKAREITELLGRRELDRALAIVEEHLSSLDQEHRNELIGKVVEEVSKTRERDTTTFYVFSVSGLALEYRGSFTVPGKLLDQFAMEETGNYFVVATTESQYSVNVYYAPIYPVQQITPPESSTIHINECLGNVCTEKKVEVKLERTRASLYPTIPSLHVFVQPVGDTSNNVLVVDLASLQVVGSLTGLATGERIYSARLIRNILFLVTFREVDPLFAIDISEPRNPRVLGYLKIPGFSEYLHPLPGDRLLGVGVEESSGLKITLFDVSDPVSMKEVSKVTVTNAWSPVLRDHHAIAVYFEKELVLLPFSAITDYYAPSGALAIAYRGDMLKVSAVLGHENCQRVVYVGNELYTVSPDLVKVFDADSYRELGRIVLS